MNTRTCISEPTTAPIPGAHPLRLDGGTQLWLLPQRAVWWPAENMAFVADVHFGKAATFRRSGQPVPHGTTADNLARLSDLLAVTGAQHLVFLGDFLHARAGSQAHLWEQLEGWREQHARVKMTLVRGNHDRHAGDPPASLAVDVVNEPWRPLPQTEILAGHHPHPVDDGTLLAGHLHPTVTLFGPARDALRLPCFAWSPGLLVLPAFGAFTGMSSQSVDPQAQRFAVVAGRTVRV